MIPAPTGAMATRAHESISADGSTVVYQSNASDLVAQDTNGFSDVFAYKLATGMTSLVSANISNADSGDQQSFDPVVDGNGTEVAFLSNADDLQAITKLRHNLDVFVRNLTSATTTLVSVNAAGDSGGTAPPMRLRPTWPSAPTADGCLCDHCDRLDGAGFDELRPALCPQPGGRTTAMVSTNAAGTAGSDANASGVTLSSDGFGDRFRTTATT